MSTLFAFLHHVLAFTLVGCIAVEFILLGLVRSNGLTAAAARRLVVTDAVLGAAAGLLLIVGLCRVFFFEKGADYYFHSHAFLTKLALFIIVALASITPAVEFLKWRRALNAEQVPQIAPESCAPSGESFTASWPPSSSSCFARRSWRAAAGSSHRTESHSHEALRQARFPGVRDSSFPRAGACGARQLALEGPQ